MKKHAYCMLTVLFLVTLAMSSAQTLFAENSANMNLFFGSKSLDSADWSPLEEQSEFGIKFDIGEKSEKLKFAFDLLSSSTTESYYDYDYGISLDLTGSTSEMNLGVRSYSDPSGSGAFFGGGLSFIDAEIGASAGGVAASESTSAVGFWFELGAQMRAGDNVNLGLDLIFSTAVDDEYDVELGGMHLGFFVGLAF